MNEIESDVDGVIAEIYPAERPGGRVRRAALRHPDELGLGADVQEDPDRQPGRDRAPHHPGLQGAGDPDGRRLQHGRPRQPPRHLRRRGRLHRSAAVEVELPQHLQHHLGRRDHRRRRHPSGLRLPRRERPLRRGARRVQDRLDRAAPGGHPPDGRQGQGAADGEGGGRAGAPRQPGAAGGREPGGGPRGRGRLPGDPQGVGRRRRARHADRPRRGRPRAPARGGPRGGGEGLRRRLGLPREVPDGAAAHRVPGLRRHATATWSTWASASARSSAATRS